MQKKLIALAVLLGMMVSAAPFTDVNFTTVYAAETAEEKSGSEGSYMRDAHINITVQPQSVSVTEGETATFSVKVAEQTRGVELAYQWQISNDEGETWHDVWCADTAEYTVTATRDKDDSLVRCVVSDSEGHTVISQMARLTAVMEAQLNVNPDDFEIEGDTLVRYKGDAEEVYIPDGVKRIAFSSKESGKNAKSIIIPASVTDIQVFTFHQTGWHANNVIFPNLESITVDKNNPVFASKDGVLFNKNFTKLVHYPAMKKGAYVIPNTVTDIDDHAFVDCEGLTSLTLPSSLQEIPSVHGCWNLSHIDIPASVSEISYGAFGGLPICTYVEVDSDNPYYASKDGVLFNKDMTTLEACLLDVFGREDMTDEQYQATRFDGYYAVPDTVTTIGGVGCIGLGFTPCALHNIAIPRSVTTIEAGAFGILNESCWITDVYYEGSKEEWERIQIGDKDGDSNEVLRHATIHYNFEGLSEKTNIVMMDSFRKTNASPAANDETELTAPAESTEYTPEVVSEAADLLATSEETVCVDLAESVPEITPETADLPAEAGEAVRVDLAEAVSEIVPETADLPAEAGEAVRVDLAEAVPEILPETADLPAVTEETISLASAAESESVTDIWQFSEEFETLDEPITMTAEFDLPENKAETADNIVGTNDTPTLTAEDYVPSVLSNALCMNLGIWGIALSLACAVVTKRRRRFLVLATA